MGRVNDPKYKSYSNSYQDKPVEYLLKASGIDLSNGAGLEELQHFLSAKKLYFLYDSDGYYKVITNIKVAMAKTYVCNACETSYDLRHKCNIACTLCTATPPCTKDQTRYCGTCNRSFLSKKCFQCQP